MTRRIPFYDFASDERTVLLAGEEFPAAVRRMSIEMRARDVPHIGFALIGTEAFMRSDENGVIQLEIGDEIRHDFAAWPPTQPTINGQPIDGVTRIALDRDADEHVARVTLEMFPRDDDATYVQQGAFVPADDVAEFIEWRKARDAAKRAAAAEAST